MKKQAWYTPYFKDKKITVMGLGLLGRGIGDTAFMAGQGASLLVTDKKNKTELAPALEKLSSYNTISYRLGEHKVEDFKNADMVMKAAGVPLDSEYISEARRNSVPVEMSAALLVRLVKEHFGDEVLVIGVTGTRGKTTTTMLVHHVLKSAGKKVHLAGNVRGLSNLTLLPKITKGDIIVLELDSWQLQGFGEAKISPDISIFTTFLDDHMNYYKGDVEKYFYDKANIFTNQKDTATFKKVLIVSNQAKKEIAKRFPKQKMVTEVKGSFADEFVCPLVGEHNTHNIRLAAIALEYAGLTRFQVKKGLATVKAEAGRLEYCGQIKGIHVYDDNNATSPDAVIAALDAISKKYPGKKIHLLCGGAEKQSILLPLIKKIKKEKPTLYMLEGTGTNRFLTESKITEMELFSNFKSALKKVFESSKKGEVVLFSPGFASFGMFINEYDREDQFKKIINQIAKK